MKKGHFRLTCVAQKRRCLSSLLCFKQPSIRVVSTHNLSKKLKAPFFVWVSFVGRNCLGHWFSATPPWDSRNYHYLLNVSGQKPKPLSRAEHRSPYLFCIKFWLVCWSIWICYNWAGLLLLCVLITTLKWRKLLRERKKEAREGGGGGGGKLFFVTRDRPSLVSANRDVLKNCSVNRGLSALRETWTEDQAK